VSSHPGYSYTGLVHRLVPTRGICALQSYSYLHAQGSLASTATLPNYVMQWPAVQGYFAHKKHPPP